MNVADRASVALRLPLGAANGSIEPDEALRKWPEIDDEMDELITESWHELSHFANDWDIRQRDRAYDELMRAKLIGYAREIKARYAL